MGDAPREDQASRQTDGHPRDLRAAAALAALEIRAAPGAVVAAALGRGGSFSFGAGAAGRLVPAGDAPAVHLGTPFDLASLTKPVTALTAARLARAGLLSWGERLGDLLPDLAGSASAGVTLELLAAHRAGLEGHGALFGPLLLGEPIDRKVALRQAANGRRAECVGDAPAEGFPPIYSDLGYLLLGEAIATRVGDDLDRVMEREVLAPLGLRLGSARWFRGREGAAFDDEVAPTEIAPWRGGLVRGEVHDENAWALAGDAAAGHAGLFGDAPSVARLGAGILDALRGRRDAWLAPADLSILLRTRPGGSLLAGFDARSGEAPSSGSRFGPRTFGHLGFTGTSVWIDPDQELCGVLLTNRVHPTRATDAIKRARPAVYDALAAAMLG